MRSVRCRRGGMGGGTVVSSGHTVTGRSAGECPGILACAVDQRTSVRIDWTQNAISIAANRVRVAGERVLLVIDA